MIPVSPALRALILAGNKQRALLYYVEQGLYFTVNDIILGSWKYTGTFNPDSELTAGKAVSASLNYSLVNADGALDNFGFGEFNAYMGVKTGEFPYRTDEYTNVVLDYQGNRYAGRSTAPYLTRNGEAFSTQPSTPIEAMIVIDDVLYCLTSTRTVLAIRVTDATHWEDLENSSWLSQESYTWDSYDGTYSVWETTITDDLKWKMCQRYIAKHSGVSIINNTDALIFENGVAEAYTYTQVGHFYSERPARVRVNVVKVESYDAMDARLNQLATGLTTPTTLRGLYDQIVQVTGVTSKVTSLLNGTLPVPSIDFSDMTYREVLGLIGQASGTYALFDYDGRLDMRWFTNTSISLDESNYTSYIPYEYTVEAIDKLQVRSTDSDIGIIVGTGSNAYVIQNNPFLVFDSDQAGRPYCRAIYDRLNGFGTYTPGSLRWFVDFTVQPGDVITVNWKNDAYRFPIFTQSYTWSAISVGTAESTGTQHREVLNAVNRKEWRQQSGQVKKYTEITATIDGITAKTGINNLSTGETLYSMITTNANSVELTFKKIGASGYTATGITTITENGITVRHTSMANCYTQMAADGFKLYNSSNQQIGGMMLLNGSVVAAVQSLYNPLLSNLSVTVGNDIYGGEEDGLLFKLGATDCFGLTGAENTFRLRNSDGSCSLYGSDGGIYLSGNSYAEMTGPQNCGIWVNSSGHVIVRFKYGNNIYEQDMYDIWQGGID